MTRRGLLAGESAAESWGFKGRKSPEADLDITPMIDCVFLLLIFFMVSSTMRGNADQNVPGAKHGVGVDTRSVSTVRIEAADPAPRILLDNRESTLDDVRAFVEEGMQSGNSLVVIKADREVPHGFVQQVTRVVNSVEGVKFSIGVQDKKKRN
jgi:biopolymer transport protein TolR